MGISVNYRLIVLFDIFSDQSFLKDQFLIYLFFIFFYGDLRTLYWVFNAAFNMDISNIDVFYINVSYIDVRL